MPKERVGLNDDEAIEIGWSRVGEYVQIGVEVPEEIVVLSDHPKGRYAEVTHALFGTITEKKDFEKLLKALKRAGKQAFEKS